MSRWFLLLLPVLLAVGLLLGCGPADVEDYENPYDLGLDQYHEVAPSLLRWQEIGRLQVGNQQLHGVAAGPGQRCYVTAGAALWIFDDRTLVQQIELGEPAYSLAAAADGRLYLAGLDHVRVMTADYARTRDWPALNRQSMLTSIAVDEQQVVVADAGNHTVLRYDLDGTLLNRIADKDPDRGIPGLLLPSPYLDVAIDAFGTIQVVNPGRHAIESYTPDGSLRASWSKTAMTLDGFCGCCNPIQLALLPDGAMVTAEKGLPRVKVLAPTGELRSVVAGPADFAEDAIISDLAVTGDQRILVVDQASQSVRIYGERSEP